MAGTAKRNTHKSKKKKKISSVNKYYSMSLNV